jgi:Uma2 family endonuclease
MVQTPAKSLTLEEFLKLPETKPASEYSDGQISQKPMPKAKHSAIQTELSSAINRVVKVKRVARAFSKLRCTFGRRSVVPDISVFVWERIARDNSGEVADKVSHPPDWTIEILSPNQSISKVTKNILHCLAHETQMGWLIDPKERVVFVYYADRPTQFFDVAEQQIPIPDFASEFRLTVAELFGWLSD